MENFEQVAFCSLASRQEYTLQRKYYDIYWDLLRQGQQVTYRNTTYIVAFSGTIYSVECAILHVCANEEQY